MNEQIDTIKKALADPEGATIWEATTKESSPTAASTTMMYFDV